jgi:uncharacterized repeat protein (TIGR03806 family)
VRASRTIVRLAATASLAGCHSAAESAPDAGHDTARDAGVTAARDASVDAPKGRPPADASSDAPAQQCHVGGDGGYVDTPFQKLSAYCIASIQDGGIALGPGVVPYDLNTPLFSDYAIKVRGVWVPPGAHATYSDGGAMTFPPGTILTKSFGFADDMRKASPVVRWVETRLVISTASGYVAYTYIWDADGKDATLSYAGEVLPLEWIGVDGGAINANYLVPSYDQCKQCHNLDGVVTPIGPKARQLNRDFDYPDGGENELAHWSRIGILEGAPDAAAAPKLPVWNDPTTGTVSERARAYLEGNCAHCHNAEGTAFTTGLFLLDSEETPTAYGICKPPVAAGAATGGDSYDIVPGDPSHSIMVYRLSSTTPGVMMPQIGRSVVDTAGLALIEQWIGALDGGCQ